MRKVFSPEKRPVNQNPLKVTWNTFSQLKSYGPCWYQRWPEYFMNSVLTHFSFCCHPQSTIYIKTLTYLHHSFIVPAANLWWRISKILKTAGNFPVFHGQSVSMADLLLDLPLITDTEGYLMQLHLETWYVLRKDH